MLVVQPHVLLYDGIQIDFMVVLKHNHSVDAEDFAHVCYRGRIGHGRVSGHLSFCVKRGLGELSIQLLCEFYIAALLELVQALEKVVVFQVFKLAFEVGFDVLWVG